LNVIDGGFAKPKEPDLQGRIPARNAMIVWEPATAEGHAGLGIDENGRLDLIPKSDEVFLGRMRAAWQKPTTPEVRVFDDVTDHAGHDRYDHLSCSLGRCCAGWCEQDPMADLFRSFLAVIADGVPLAAVHREFLKIDEYYRMLDRREFFGVEAFELEEV
jgi:hypothetical protein